MNSNPTSKLCFKFVVLFYSSRPGLCNFTNRLICPQKAATENPKTYIPLSASILFKNQEVQSIISRGHGGRWETTLNGSLCREEGLERNPMDTHHHVQEELLLGHCVLDCRELESPDLIRCVSV